MIIPNNAKNVGDKWVERFRVFYVNGKKYQGRYVFKNLESDKKYDLLGNRFFRTDNGEFVPKEVMLKEYDKIGIVTRGLGLTFDYYFNYDEDLEIKVNAFFIGWELEEIK